MQKGQVLIFNAELAWSSVSTVVSGLEREFSRLSVPSILVETCQRCPKKCFCPFEEHALSRQRSHTSRSTAVYHVFLRLAPGWQRFQVACHRIVWFTRLVAETSVQLAYRRRNHVQNTASPHSIQSSSQNRTISTLLYMCIQPVYMFNTLVLRRCGRSLTPLL